MALSLGDIRSEAIKEISEYISSVGGSPTEFKVSGIDLCSAWKLSIDVNGRKIEVIIAVDLLFPFTKPQFYVSKEDHFLKYPHVEETGRLCLLPDQATFSHRHPTEVLKSLIDDARQLLNDSYEGKNVKDFENEFCSYWNRCITPDSSLFYSTIKPVAPSRIIAVSERRNRLFLGENIYELEKWISNRLGSDEVGKLVEGAFFWLDQPLYPNQYPNDGNDLINIVHKESGLLFSIIGKMKNLIAITILFGFDTDSGPALAGIKISPSQKKVAGYRPGRADPREIWERYYSRRSCDRHKVERADSLWIHTRGGNPILQSSLYGKSVCLIGCGSLGADIAHMLAKSGVSALYLIDKDILSYGNIGRHLLGAKYVGKNKAQALCDYLNKHLPHLNITYSDEDWRLIIDQKPFCLENYDVIVSTTADWGSDDLLNILCRKNANMPPIVYGWFEAHGCAGHALAVMDIGGCLRCGMDECGVFSRSVCWWPDEHKELIREPACGAFYNPYGVEETIGTKLVLLELILDVLSDKVKNSVLRSWIGRESYLYECGGRWNTDWVKLHGNPGCGQIIISEEWKIASDCQLCR